MAMRSSEAPARNRGVLCPASTQMNFASLSHNLRSCSQAVLLLFGLALSHTALAENWPCWRGPRLDGSSHEANVPLRWSATNNLAWKVELPGVGHASPIVFDNYIFIATALLESQQRILMSLDRNTGQIFWQQTVLAAPLEHKNALNSFASSTPATDGELVFAAFLDRNQMFVAAYDFNGKQRWAVHPGPFASMHGFCSSPVLYRMSFYGSLPH